MSDILQEIVAHKRIEVERFKAELSEQEIHRRVNALLDFSVASMRQALTDSPTGIIAEFKRRSPSKGWIKEEGRADQIPYSYQQNGAAALSILTDEKYFGGHDDFIGTARKQGVTIPVLYKNFVIDEYQLFQARLCGASAVLLIAACLTVQQCSSLLKTAHELGMEVLLEMHDEHTDVETSFRLADRLRSECGYSTDMTATTSAPVLVSESGISNPKTVCELRDAGFRGFLIGETFMKTPDPGQALHDFINQICNMH